MTTTQIFLRARELSGSARARFLQDSCGDDPRRRAEVETLLRNDELAERWLPEEDPHRVLEELAEEALESPGPAPRNLGKFPLLRVLGRGGMGIVYLSEQDNPRRPIALKVLRSEFLGLESQRRFEKEAAILARLRHPGIAQVYEAGTCRSELGDLPYLAMEYVRGTSLLEHAAELPIRERVRLIAEIADAVQHAHSLGIVHRDLKPSNVLVEPSGQVKVLDFGIARASVEGTALTLTGELLGTLPYMSPEQLAGASNVDARSDVYSLGVTLHQLLTGRLPIEIKNESLPEAIRRLSIEEPERPRKACPELDRGLEAITLRALSRERAARYATAGELAADLRSHLDGTPIQARPTSFLSGVRVRLHRHRAVAVATALAAVLVPLLAWWEGRPERDAHYLELLSIAEEVRGLHQAAFELWPSGPFRAAELEGWIEHATRLVEGLPALENELSTLASLAPGAMNADQKRLRDLLDELVGTLGQWANPDPVLGRIADLRRRLEEGSRDLDRFVGEDRRAWEECLALIEASPRYDGLRLDAMHGLVPLREDPNSGLWEFWHKASGARPGLDPGTDRWRILAETGIVLILVPGGRFAMGAQSVDPALPSYDYNVLPECGPVHEVSLSPFLLSRYELTQAQWQRLTGLNPSHWTHEGEPGYGTYPVEQVSQEEAALILRTQWNLDLPSEAWWEYAARAGTNTIWFGGDDFESLGRYANLKDQRYRCELDGDDVFVPWDDGHAAHAPVGSFEPNPLGFHDILGNVMEWCRDPYGPYEFHLLTGETTASDARTELRAVRGGSYQSNVSWTRSAMRLSQPKDTRRPTLGIRPAGPCCL